MWAVANSVLLVIPVGTHSSVSRSGWDGLLGNLLLFLLSLQVFGIMFYLGPFLFGS